MKNLSQEITIYTDGACTPNPGPGGWAALIIIDGKHTTLTGSDPQTTNNRMELTAAIEALKLVKKGRQITLFTDSEYLQKGIEDWLPRWIEKNWKGSSGKVANRDLWESLIEATQHRHIAWQWLRGHAGNRWNMMVDKLARDAIQQH
jgi:ribonuclease HI